jgi:hypothetical protein
VESEPTIKNRVYMRYLLILIKKNNDMKKTILIIIFVIINVSSYCQFQLGIKTGYNWYKILQSDNDYHPSSFNYDRNSVPISIYFCQRNHLVNLSFELEYLNRSYSVYEYWGGLGFGGNAQYEIKSYYLNALIEPQFTFGRKIKFLIFPGIYVGTPVYSTINGTLYEFSLEQYSRTTNLDGSAKGCIPIIDFGALFGVGIEFPIYKNFIITIQDIFSISIVPTKSKWGDDTYRYMQNKGEVGLAYQFSKKNKTKDK